MKKILSLALGMSFVLGTLAFAQDSSQGGQSQTDTKSSKKSKKHKKGNTSTDTTTAPKK
jgi:hypothetical protein